MEETIRYLGLDVHKESIEVAIAEGGRGGEVRHYGRIAATPAAVAKLIARLRERGGRLVACYEAGPCGYGLHRQLISLGVESMVVAPSLIPRKPGERVKSDRRDCLSLARLHRAGELTPVWVPDPAHEAVRDLVRLKAAAQRDFTRARQHLQSFLLRHGLIYQGRTPWSRAHRLWLAGLRFPHPAQQIALQDMLHAIEAHQLRLRGLDVELRRLLPDWSMAPVVAAYQALRGVSEISATTLAAELGDLSRFSNPRQLMGYLGLTASEHSSGKRRRQGAITKAGNAHARRVLVEGARSYRLPARIAKAKLASLERQPKVVRDIAWKAQTRLCARYRRLAASRGSSNIAVVAVAREMAAFLWAIAQVAPPSFG